MNATCNLNQHPAETVVISGGYIGAELTAHRTHILNLFFTVFGGKILIILKWAFYQELLFRKMVNTWVSIDQAIRVYYPP